MIASESLQIFAGTIWKPVGQNIDTSSISNSPAAYAQNRFSFGTNTALWSTFADSDGDNGCLIHTLKKLSAKLDLGFAFQIGYET